MRRKVIAVYAIKNINTGVAYIGGSKNVICRFSTHRVKLRSGLHANSRLQQAWRNDGEGAFCFEIIELVNDISMLLAREQYWIDKNLSEGSEIYNIALIAGNTKGVFLSDERKAKIAAAKTGRKASIEDRLKMSQSHKGILHTDEAKRKISIARAGSRHSDDTKMKMSLSQRKRYSSGAVIV